MYSVLPHPTIIMLPRSAFLTHHYVHVASYTGLFIIILYHTTYYTSYTAILPYRTSYILQVCPTLDCSAIMIPCHTYNVLQPYTFTMYPVLPQTYHILPWIVHPSYPILVQQANEPTTWTQLSIVYTWWNKTRVKLNKVKVKQTIKFESLRNNDLKVSKFPCGEWTNFQCIIVDWMFDSFYFKLFHQDNNFIFHHVMIVDLPLFRK